MVRLSKIFLFALLFISTHLFSVELNRYSTTASAVDSAGVAVDGLGNIYHMVRVNSSNQFVVTKTDNEGALDTGFGTSGVKTITVANSNDPTSGSTVNIGGFAGFGGTQESFISVDGNNKLVIAFLVTISSYQVVYFVRLTTAGAFDTTLSSDGVVGITISDTTYVLKDFIIDNANAMIAASYKSSNGDIYIAKSNAAGTTTQLNLVDASVENANAKSSVSLSVNESDRIYLSGTYGSTPGQLGVYAIKFQADFFTVDATFASGRYESGNLALNDNEGKVFSVVEGTGSFGKLHLIYLASNNQAINAKQLYLGAGGLAGNLSVSLFSSNSRLTDVYMRSSDNKIYIVGKTISGGPEVAFLGRLSSALVGDTGFAESGDDNYIVNGVVKIPLTDGPSTLMGGMSPIIKFGYAATSPAVVAIGYAEQAGATKRFVRAMGTEDGVNFLNAPVPPITPSSVVAAVAAHSASRARKDRAFKHLTLTGSNVTSIDDTGMVTTPHDDIFAYFRSGDFYVISKITEEGTFDTDFGTNGHSRIRLKASGGNTTTAAIGSFASIVTSEKSFITYDPLTHDIVIQFKVNISGGNTQIGVFRVKGDTGLLDTGWGAGGVKTIGQTGDTQKPQGVLVDSNGKTLFFVHHTSGATKTVHAYRTTVSGATDNPFGSSSKVDLSAGSFLTDAESGIAVCYDYLENIYIAGQYLNGGNRGLFCVRLTDSGAIDTGNFAISGTAGLYKTATFSELDGSSTDAFLSMYEYDTDRNMQLIAQGVSGGNPGVVVQQINVADGTADSTFGTAGKQFVQVANLTKLNAVKRNENGELFFGGTVTESAVKKTCLVRVKKDGTLDTGFGDTSGSSKLGVARLDAESTWVIQDGGQFDVDTGSSVPLISVESKGSSRRVILQRLAGTDDLEFDVTAVDNGKNLREFILTHHLNSAAGLSGMIYLDGIVADLKTAWEAVGGVVDSAAVASGVAAFKSSVSTVLARVVARASSNSFGSCLAIANKTGHIKKNVLKAVKAAVTSGQYTAMLSAMNTAFNTIFTRLDFGREGVTGTKRKKRKTQ